MATLSDKALENLKILSLKDDEENNNNNKLRLDLLPKTENNETMVLPDVKDLPFKFDMNDLGNSAIAGVGDTVTFLLDIPSLISKGTAFVRNDIVHPLAMKAIKASQEILDISDVEMAEFEDRINKKVEFEKKNTKIENDKYSIGTKLNDKLEKNNVYPFNYESSTAGGKIVKTAVEYALPSILFAPAGYGKIMTATGAASGAVGETITQAGTGNDNALAGTLTGVGLNIAADIIALKKGNAQGLAKRIVDSFTDAELEAAKLAQKTALKDGLETKVSDVLDGSVINKVEQDVMATEVGMNIIDKFWKTRPKQLKNYIRKFAKDMGLIKNQKVLSEAEQFQNIKNVAMALETNRAFLWKKSGGLKIKDFNYDIKSVDKIVLQMKDIAKKTNDKELVDFMNKYAVLVKKSKGDGAILHRVFREIRDARLNLNKNINKTISQESQITSFKEVGDSLDSLMATNKNYKPAQESYIAFTKAYLTDGFNKVQFFKDIKLAKKAIYTNQDLTGKIYKFFASDKVLPKDIKLMAEAFAESGKVTKGMTKNEIAKVEKNQNAWRDIISGYFETNFLQAHTKGMEKGLSDGSNLYKAIMNNPIKRANMAEMLYQLAKQQDKTIQKIDIQKSLDSFATILKGTGNRTAIGSNTFDKFSGADAMGKNEITTILGKKGGIPFSEMIGNFFFERARSKSSEQLAKALVSANGVDELIKLSKGWKDPNNAKMFIVNILKLGQNEEAIN
jgi:hypothetical protein